MGFLGLTRTCKTLRSCLCCNTLVLGAASMTISYPTMQIEGPYLMDSEEINALLQKPVMRQALFTKANLGPKECNEGPP